GPGAALTSPPDLCASDREARALGQRRRAGDPDRRVRRGGRIRREFLHVLRGAGSLLPPRRGGLGNALRAGRNGHARRARELDREGAGRLRADLSKPDPLLPAALLAATACGATPRFGGADVCAHRPRFRAPPRRRARSFDPPPAAQRRLALGARPCRSPGAGRGIGVVTALRIQPAERDDVAALSALEQFHPDGRVAAVMIAGRGAAGVALPTERTEDDHVDLLVVAPSRAEARTPGWFDEVIAAARPKLAVNAVVYVVADRRARRRAVAALKRNGLHRVFAVAHV